MGSEPLSLDKLDLKKLARNAAIAAAGAVLTVLAQYFSSTDFGMWNAVIVPLAGGAIDLARRFLSDNSGN